jgi:YVTN family beta-propeller protein
MRCKTTEEIAMCRGMLGCWLLLGLIGCSRGSQAKDGPPAPDAPAVLRQVGTIELPGVEGRFDHFAANVKGNRLYVAALGNNSVEVIDTRKGERAGSIKGLRKPTGVAFVPEAGRLVVANGDDGTVRFYDAATLAPAGRIEGLDDADNVRYDARAGRLYAGYGGGALAVIDAAQMQKIGQVKLDGHPESFQLEKDGGRIFVNVPDAKHVAVIDRQKGAVVAKWPLADARANFPMALDEPNHRLFVGCREPATVLVIDTRTGKTVASLPCVGDTDDLFYDAANARLYVSGGEGAISVFQQSGANEYGSPGSVKTAPGARTSFFVPETGMLYLAIPHRDGQRAELRVLQARSARP